MLCDTMHCPALLLALLCVSAAPSQPVLRSALEALLEGADMATVTYSELHKQLEAQFKVRPGREGHGCLRCEM